MLNVKQLTPMILARDFEASLTFYQNLGFTLGFRSTEPDYAYLYCQGAAIRILKAGEAVDLTSPDAEHILYFDVEDVDALWSELLPFLATLPREHVRAPFDQFYGQREFHVIEGPHLLMFGQEISKA